MPLIDPYDIYQHLMDYWAEVMQDDAYLLVAEGWDAAKMLRLTTGDETPDFTHKLPGQKKASKFIGQLIPTRLVVETYFRDLTGQVESLQAALDERTRQRVDFEEENSLDEGASSGLGGEKGITKAEVLTRVLALVRRQYSHPRKQEPLNTSRRKRNHQSQVRHDILEARDRG